MQCTHARQPARCATCAYTELKALQQRMADMRRRDWPHMRLRQQPLIAAKAMARRGRLSAVCFGETWQGVALLDRARRLRAYLHNFETER